MSEHDPMSPDVSPGSLPRKTGVRRVNRVPLLLIGAVLLGFAIMIGLVAADRASQQAASGTEQKPEEEPGNTAMFAKEIAGKQTDGFIPPEMPEPPKVPKDEPVFVAKPPPVGPTDKDTPPRPPPNLRKSAYTPPSGTMPEDSDASRIRTARMRALEEAIKSPTSVQFDGAAGSGGGRNSLRTTRDVDRELARLGKTDPQAEYMKQLAVAQKIAQGGGGASRGSFAPDGMGRSRRAQAADDDPNSLSRFDSEDPDRWQLKSRPRKPGSPYELRAGFVIPAMLISGINSELPGQIIAQVTQSVYDTPTGRYVLIPQGSRLIGAYASDVAFGQARVFVGWQRIVFPDGKAMDIGAMPGSDSAGYAGFQDQVNNHYMRLFGSAFMLSAITAGVTMSQDRRDRNDAQNNNRMRAGDAMSEALGQQLGQVMAQLIAKNMNVAPTLEIRPGYRFNVMVTKDMTFRKPYEAFDY